MLIGDSGVGKTCLLVRFKDGAFLSGSFISTVGIDFRVSVVSLRQRYMTWRGKEGEGEEDGQGLKDTLICKCEIFKTRATF